MFKQSIEDNTYMLVAQRQQKTQTLGERLQITSEDIRKLHNYVDEVKKTNNITMITFNHMAAGKGAASVCASSEEFRRLNCTEEACQRKWGRRNIPDLLTQVRMNDLRDQMNNRPRAITNVINNNFYPNLDIEDTDDNEESEESEDSDDFMKTTHQTDIKKLLGQTSGMRMNRQKLEEILRKNNEMVMSSDDEIDLEGLSDSDDLEAMRQNVRRRIVSSDADDD